MNNKKEWVKHKRLETSILALNHQPKSNKEKKVNQGLQSDRSCLEMVDSIDF